MKLPVFLVLLWARDVLPGTTTRGFEIIFCYWMYRMDYELIGTNHQLGAGCRANGQTPCDFHDFVKYIESIGAESSYDPRVGRTHIADPMNPQLAEKVVGRDDHPWGKGKTWIKGYTGLSFSAFLGEDMNTAEVANCTNEHAGVFDLRGFYMAEVEFMLQFILRAQSSGDQGLKDRISDMVTKAKEAMKVTIAGRVMEYSSAQTEKLKTMLEREKVDVKIWQKTVARWIDNQAMPLRWNGGHQSARQAQSSLQAHVERPKVT
ncbi:oxidoreductase [Apiospora arundinis]